MLALRKDKNSFFHDALLALTLLPYHKLRQINLRRGPVHYTFARPPPSNFQANCRETAFCFHLRRRPRHLSREREKRFYYLEERYAQVGPPRISIPARLVRVRIETIMPRRSYAGFSLRGYESPLWKLLQRIFMKAINNIHYSRRSSFALDSIGFTGERAPS